MRNIFIDKYFNKLFCKMAEHNLIIHPEDMINIDDENEDQAHILLLNPNTVISIYVTPDQFTILIPKGSEILKEAPKHKRV